MARATGHGQLAEQIQRKVGVPRAAEIHVGVITFVNPVGVATVQLNGSAAQVPDVPYLSSYSPVAGDTVLVALLGSDSRLRQRWVILGVAQEQAVGWTSYTPTWTASTTNPTLSNGTLVGRYARTNGKTCALRISLSVGSSDSLGTGTYGFALPFAGSSIGVEQEVLCKVFTGTTDYVGFGFIPAGSAVVYPYSTAGGTGGSAVALGSGVVAAGGNVQIQGTYETA